MPGAGAIPRLPRMLGLQGSFPYLMEGKQVGPQEARAAGMVDELAGDPDEMMARARAWIAANPGAMQPWDRRDYRMPGGDPGHPRMMPALVIAPAMLRQKTYGNYPAPEAIMNAAVEGAQVDFEIACRIESRYFAQIVTGKVAKNMLSALWFQLNSIKAGTSRPAGIEPQRTRKLGVLGAGMMGHGIAYVSALAGMDVVLKDVTLEKAQQGLARIRELLAEGVARGRVSPANQAEVLTRILPTESAQDLQGCDLIIEAVFEDRELKAAVTRGAEAQISPDAVFGTNTSTLPITGLARASCRPENFVGVHFFSPVHRMRLVELIRGERTSDGALAKAFDYVLQIGKTPIVVRDSRGFYTSRVFGTYLNEGAALLAEGQHPRAIESAGRQAGMPVGPLALMDEINLGLVRQIREQTRRDLALVGREMPRDATDQMIDLMAEELGRPGKAQGAGFYEYPASGKFLWPGLEQQFPAGARQLSQAEMILRFMAVQALETVRCLEEGVLTSVADANIGSIFGWGFAPFKGGTLQYINDFGLPTFVASCRDLAERYGARFEPPARLVSMAEKGEVF
jgi:3-hydroxyacyl-CoA dehydrogenase/enoyl-CoA hydratase/3-hydroxybutyryl-CoA epimerase